MKVKANYKDPYEIANFIKDYIDENTVIVCIGTDKCIGDALGPLVGTMLKEKRFPYPVFGTLEEPIHALNLEKRVNKVKDLYPKANIIGVDACIGKKKEIGQIQARDFPIRPGEGAGKKLSEVGTVSIVGIVIDSDEDMLFAYRNIRLSFVMAMSKCIVDSLTYATYMQSKLQESEKVADTL